MTTTIKTLLIMLLLSIGLVSSLLAHKPNSKDGSSKPQVVNLNTEINLRTDCTATNAQVDLKVNNVQARLQVGGDIWWDRQDGRYIVPKVEPGSGQEEVSSLFAGGVWLGGYDPGGNLKLAASTYGVNGYDYYAGPLDDETGLTDDSACQQWDEFFTVSGDDVRKAVRDYDDAVENGAEYTLESIPLNVKTWPGQGNENFLDRYGFSLPDTKAGLGSFWDENLDGIYNPELGDFPTIDIRGCVPTTRKEAIELVPDEMIFWIYNDAGGIHNESNAQAIRMEVQVQAFAYATNDAINDMTFYRYKLINRASEDIRDTYFAMWVDPDLGCHTDDYSGCDVSRSLAYTYNSDEIDGSEGDDCEGGAATYGASVPMIGTDYFRGPLAPKVICATQEAGCIEHVVKKSDQISAFSNVVLGDTIFIRDPNFGLGEEGDFGLELGMSSCMIYNNRDVGTPDSNTGDPETPEQYYNYLDGRWLNGEPMTRGGIGLNPGAPESDITKYAFSDPPALSGGWSMWEERLPLGDRRTVQASGPFLLKPNAINELIVGAVWVPDVRHPGPSLAKITAADDIAQSLFDECFDIIDGPDAPTINTIELDQEIILVLNNDRVESNNANLDYMEIDIFAGGGEEKIEDSLRYYVFEGYKIFQLSSPNVSTQQLNDIDKARMVAQVDLENNISELYNWSAIENPISAPGETNLVWIPELKVSGSNQGIQNTFKITTDQFSAENPKLVNHKEYYYMAVAYAYNEFERFDDTLFNATQPRPYLEGRGNIETYTAIPRPIVYEDVKSAYGDGAAVTRINGVGLGGNAIDMEEEMYDKILSGAFDGRIDYKEGAGPITVKVYNPLEVKDGKFQLEILGEHLPEEGCQIGKGATWKVTHLDSGQEYYSDRDIDEINEQLIAEFGISLVVKQSHLVGTNIDPSNGALSAITAYDVVDVEPWFRGITDRLQDVPDEEIGFGRALFDFIKTASEDTDPEAFRADPDSRFQSLGNGTWYPFPLVSSSNDQVSYVSPAWSCGDRQGALRPSGNILKHMNNVDIIMTPDKSKWSRCVVVETGSQLYFPDDCSMLEIKLQPSRGIDGGIDDSINETGMSYFPGYAVDVETGKRLNIFFGENSYYNSDLADDFDDEGLAIGDDMLYNPSDQFFHDASDFTGLINGDAYEKLFMGGHHYIYVTRQEYDGCAHMRDTYNESAPFFSVVDSYGTVTWCSMTMCQPGQSLLPYTDVVIPSEVKFKLRVDRPYNIETKLRLDNLNATCDPADESKMPLYEFEIRSKEAEALVEEEYADALDNVMAVPNPYYAYSSYESSQFDKTIKITNVPARAIVTIFSLDGKFITQFNRDERVMETAGANPGVNETQVLPDILWDLENSSGIPVSSGVYLIHIAAPDLGVEKTIKWFGINRKFDPSGL